MTAIKAINAVKAIVLTALLVLPSAARAQITNDSILEERTRELASVLRCPVCQGLSIEDSPSELSLQMKQVVRDQLREGKSPEQVKAYFVSKYGEWILLEPKPAGMNLAVYLMPLVLLLGGGGLIVVMVRRWTSGRTGTETETETEVETEAKALR
jgi:cytochrome c-type biogenesis protein CcmH